MAGHWILLTLSLLAADPALTLSAPRSLDSRLVFEQFANQPDIVTPTGITVDSRGMVYVIESHTHFRPEGYPGPPADRIRRLEDTDGDGKADRVTTFYEGSKFTMGMAFHRDQSLYVATRYEVFRLRDENHDGKADNTPERLVRLDTSGNYPHNGLSGFAFDSEGSVYFGLGENLGANYKLIGSDGVTLTGGGEGGNVYRSKSDGTGLERVATGFWNPFHQAFDCFGRLFVVDNDPDSRPPCRLVHTVAGGDYGYRFRNGRKGLHPFTAWNGELPGTLPMVAGTGEAPSGVIVYESDNLPHAYRGSILTTSWGDHRIERFNLEPRGASAKSTASTVITGGENFRPVGIAVAPDGSLYVSDWVDKSYTLHGKGAVWHLRAKNAEPRIIPRTDSDALFHADRAIREAAARRLAESNRSVLRETILDQGRRPGVPATITARARAAALDALLNAPQPDDALALRHALKDWSSAIREQAVRRIPQDLVDPSTLASQQLGWPAPLAEAMRRFSTKEWEPLLLQSLEDSDPFTRQAARMGLFRALGRDRLLELLRNGSPAVRVGVLLVLREKPGASDDALALSLADPDPLVRFTAIQWVGEERLERYRGKLNDGLIASATTRQLFEAYLAALERLDGENRGPKAEIAGEEYVAALVSKSDTPPQLVRRALRMLRPEHPALTLSRLSNFLDSNDNGLRLEAIRTLSSGSSSSRANLLKRIASQDDAPDALRAEAILGLAADASANKSFLINIAAGPNKILRHEAIRSLRSISLSNQDKEKLGKQDTSDPETAAQLALLQGPAAVKTEPLATWLKILDGPADAAAGERVFFHPKGPACYRCHQVDGRGGRVGPDLSTTASTLTRERLIESILNPSKEIAPQFVSWLVARKDGSVFTGILLDESATGQQVYGDAKGERITVEPGEIEDRKPQEISIMPADLSATMTPQEFRDLIAYLRMPR